MVCAEMVDALRFSERSVMGGLARQLRISRRRSDGKKPRFLAGALYMDRKSKRVFFRSYFWTAGSSNPIRTAIIAITTRFSINVKPAWFITFFI